ncbi:MAG TPA: prolipoprotein diacylglyceryl transferase family protein [Candidatus Limnocylindrales bacterium]|nr:prolipoprotein diacylglyceryl transferase family protein [Candidatus Limnocylindrales bacterium]
MPIAVIEFDFDPVVRLADTTVRLETLALALVVLTTVLVAARIAGWTPAEGDDPGPFVHRPRLRRDDLLLVMLGIIPGAVIGGRIGYALTHLDYYAARPAALIDPAQGSLELAGAVAGGALAGASVAVLLEGPIGRWFHVAALPTLLALGLGKAATAIGGAGQGSPSDLPWATAYLGPGPWGSLAPATPSHPAQVYEAVATIVVLIVVIGILAAGGFARRDGRLFLVAIGGWAIARAAVAAAWRDPAILGPLNAGQLIAIALGAVAFGLAVALPRLAAARSSGPGADGAEPAWPDPSNRPRF